MQQISELLQDGGLVERYDAVSQNATAIEQKLVRLRRIPQNGSGNGRELSDKIKCLEYQLGCANKGAQRLAWAIRNGMLEL